MLLHLPLTSSLRHLTHATLWNGHEVLEGVAVVGRMAGPTTWTHICDTVLHDWTATPIHCTFSQCKSDKVGDQAPQYGVFSRSHSSTALSPSTNTKSVRTKISQRQAL